MSVSMAKGRSGSRRAGASAPPAVRRQVKRARQRAAAQGRRGIGPTTAPAPAPRSGPPPTSRRSAPAAPPQPRARAANAPRAVPTAPVLDKKPIADPTAPKVAAVLPSPAGSPDTSAVRAANPPTVARQEIPHSQRAAGPAETAALPSALPSVPDRLGERAKPHSDTHVSSQPARKFPTLSAMMAPAPQTAPMDEPAAAAEDAQMSAEEEEEAAGPASRFDDEDTTVLAVSERTRTSSIAISRPEAPAAAGVRPQATRRTTGGPRTARRPRPRPLPAMDPIPPLAGVQVAVAVCGALSGASLLVVGRPAGWWPITLAVVAGIGGWLASVFAPHPRRAGWALLASQLVALAWGLALVGPRSSLLVVVGLVVLVALWLVGRGASALVAGMAIALYGVAAVLTAISAIRPALAFDASSGAVLDGAVSCLALLLMLRLALRLHTAAVKAEALALARSFELDVVRGRTDALRHQVERDAEQMRLALREAQTGAPAPAVTAAGALSPLADEIEVTAARLHALHRDREQRRQLERGIYRLVRALERAWLGLPWEWPEASGTKLDDVVALLRSPNPREIARAHLDDASGLLPIPTLDAAHTPPWAPPQPHPLAPLAEPEPLWSSGELRATYRNSGHLARQPVLPWDEWDDWRGWDASQDE